MLGYWSCVFCGGEWTELILYGLFGVGFVWLEGFYFGIVYVRFSFFGLLRGNWGVVVWCLFKDVC